MDVNSVLPYGQQIQIKENNKQVEKNNIGQNFSAQSQQQLTIETTISVSTQVSLNIGNNPLSVVLKTALENINAALIAATGQQNTIETLIGEGVDFSPQATASRILNQVTSFFDAYLETRSDTEEGDPKADFLQIIKSGIEQGFNEARDILEGLSVLEGEVASNVDLTYDLVQDGLNAFMNS